MQNYDCLNIINMMAKSVDIANDALIKNMTNLEITEPDYVCVMPDLTFDNYYLVLKSHWDKFINDMISRQDMCKTSYFIKNFANNNYFSDLSDLSDLSLKNINIENIVLDRISTSIIDYISTPTIKFETSDNLQIFIKDFINIYISNCNCKLPEIFKYMVKKYLAKYRNKLKNLNKDTFIEVLRHDYNIFKEYLTHIKNNYNKFENDNIVNPLTKILSDLNSIGVESELERLIPNELGSLKIFFKTIITAYYNNLHPIIWAQIFKSMVENIFVELPFTRNEIFAFVSKHLLLNSGPFILKILQMIRPILTPELAEKYNLTKLTYPLLSTDQVKHILNNVVYDWEKYKILAHYSASVGHVVKVKDLTNFNDAIIIKIIKPLAITQSCWEYKILSNIFPEGSCENDFVRNMLVSNGRELNVNNEKQNLLKGKKYYNASYQDLFGKKIDAELKVVDVLENIILPNAWYAIGMSLAPGYPLSKLIEDNIISGDTIYRANLHRCLDILVYKFFNNLVNNGFYHGDLHSGNIFYSYTQHKITLIDFGAVGNLNLYSDDPSIKTLLNIIVMSVFYNYDEILDTLTDLLNSKCDDSMDKKIEKNSPEYLKLREKLVYCKKYNIFKDNQEKNQQKLYQEYVFSDTRINQEKKDILDKNTLHKNDKNINKNNTEKSIYYFLDQPDISQEVIIENRDDLPPHKLNDKTITISFVEVLEEIIKFYAVTGVNIAIKFNEFYEFQKAYALLLGVLHKTGYSSYRSNIIISKAINNWKNIKNIVHIGTVTHLTKLYSQQKSKYNQLKKVYYSSSK